MVHSKLANDHRLCRLGDDLKSRVRAVVTRRADAVVSDEIGVQLAQPLSATVRTLMNEKVPLSSPADGPACYAKDRQSSRNGIIVYA